MRIVKKLIIFAIAAVFGAADQSAFGQEAPKREQFRPGKILLVPKPDQVVQTGELHRRKGRRVLKRFGQFRNLEVVQLPPGENVLAAVREYNASGAVEFAEPDYILRASVAPNDPRYTNGSQWGLNNTAAFSGKADADIDAPEAWDILHDAGNIIVAIVDSGMRMTHEDLAPNLWNNPDEIPDNNIDDDHNGYVDDVHGIDSILGTGNPIDTVGHGTHVAGIIGAVGNNGKGIAGVAWNVQLMPLRFIQLDQLGEGTGATSDAVECINYAVAHGAKVINASFGSGSQSASLQSAINAARTAGVVFVAAAGNEIENNDVTPNYPSNYDLDNIVAVAATTRFDALDTSYSNYGATKVDVGAPGTEILSCGNGSDSSYVTMSGTSMATPFVSGMMALMKAHYPTETPAQLIERLIATVDPLPSLAGKTVSGGRVNLYRALSPFVSASFTMSTNVGAFPLTVQFTNTSAGENIGYTWDFGDGSPVSTEINPNHVFTAEGVYTVTLTVTPTEGLPASRSLTVTVVPTYSFRSVAYEWIDPTNMTQLFLGDNGVSSAQSLPFTFYFYAQPKTSIYIGANGILGFDVPNMGATSNADLPSANSPNGLILPYWDNLNPGAVGAVYAGVVGEAPNRRFVASWVGVRRNSSTDTITFQAVLSETSGRIQYNYLEVRPASNQGGGARATIGVEDPTGRFATKYGYNGTPNRVANQLSLAFTPSVSGGLAVTTDSDTTLTGSVAALQASPISYSVRNTSRSPLTWSVTNDVRWLTISTSGGVLQPGGEEVVEVEINDEVATLGAGSHDGVISFVNLVSGNGNTNRVVTVEIDSSLAQFKKPKLEQGVFSLELPGTIGLTYVIEASFDLADWKEVDRGVIAPNGIIPFADPGAGTGSRFFRAQILAIP